jgi:hypothetical protein
MASKAPRKQPPKADDSPKDAVPVGSTTLGISKKARIVFTAFWFLVLVGFASPISQLNLSPVYGSIPSSLYHSQLITYVVALAYIAKRSIKKPGETKNDWGFRNYIAPWMYWTPALQYVLFQYSETFGPRWGPIITEVATFYPLLFLTFLSSTLLLDELDLQFGSRLRDATPAVISFGVFTGAEKLAVRYLPQIMGTTDFFTRTGLQLLNASLAAFLSRNRFLVFAVPAVVHTLFNNPHHYAVGPTKYINQTLFEYQYALVDRADSVTGYLSVVRNKKDGFVALRCDHSVLGGEWLVTPARKKRGQEVRETIYSVFTMLEAVRLIKNDVIAPDDEKDALFV